ncbi:MAG: restriction endonuclease [Geobacteraceae bacterium]|nr:restriction endonuclease [Geobacteraceae bacterium]
MTIVEAIKQVMLVAGKPLTPSEAYDLIVKKKLYSFNADNPSHIVRSQIRRHCKGLDFPSSKPTKHFEEFEDGKYYFLEKPLKARAVVGKPSKISEKTQPTTATINKQLKELHYSYHEALKTKILKGLKSLTPSAFELFSKKLLEVYGFHDMKVTHISKDGGIDGFGKLKIGLAEMNVAFQCKKWSTNSIHRPEVDKFRGAIQGEFEQGIFITTTGFAPGAKAVSFKRGAVPIVLIDGDGIVDLMIQKEFGVQKESLPVYSYALDLALTEEE